MRKDNYLIALVNSGVLSPSLPLTLPRWLRRAGGGGRRGGEVRRRHLTTLTKTLEWNLKWCLLDAMFDDRTFRIKKEFLKDPDRLRKGE